MRVQSLIVDSVLFAPRGFHFTHEVKEKVSELGVGESAELIFKDIIYSPHIDERATNVNKCNLYFYLKTTSVVLITL